MIYDNVVFCLALVIEFNNYNLYKYVVLDIAFIIQFKKTLKYLTLVLTPRASYL